VNKGYLVKPRLSGEKIAKLCYDHGWKDPLELVTVVAIVLSESAGFVHAHCDNLDDQGRVTSRDCGLFQINVPFAVPDDPPVKAEVRSGSKVGRAAKWGSQFELEENFRAARSLYERRGFQPWHGFTGGIALGEGYRGRYVQRAVRGVANFLAKEIGVTTLPLLDFPLRLKVKLGFRRGY